MNLVRALTLTLLLALVAAPGVAFACEAAGPNAHIGTVTAVDASKQTFKLKDAQSGMILTFTASPEMLKSIAVRDQVTVVYAAEGNTLRATAIK